MFEYLALAGSVALLFGSFGFGVYTGVRHIGEMSTLPDGPDRPAWAQEPVDAFNGAPGRPVDPDAIESNDDPDSTTEHPGTDERGRDDATDGPDDGGST